MVFVHKRRVMAAGVAALATAALLLAGNGMNPVWPVMWLAFLPILLLAAEARSSVLAAGAAFFGMLLGSLNLLHYLHGVLGAPVTAWLMPMSLASGVFAAGVLLFRTLLHRGASLSAVIALPALWTVFEFGASFVPANGTAGSFGYTQEGFLAMLQVASVTGVWGITFLLLLFPSAVVTWVYLRKRERREGAIILGGTLAALAGCMVFGIVRLAEPNAQKTMRVGLLVTDAVPFAEGNGGIEALARGYAKEAESLAHAGAEIIVMPEKIGLLRDQNAEKVNAAFQAVADRTGSALVFGVKRAGAQASYNEARIYSPNRPVEAYEKQHMLPLFESDLRPGTSLTFLPQSTGKVGVAICKDMDFIRPALNYGRAGVELLLDPAWDFNVDRAWHGHIAIMRGVEGGYAIAHAAKNGFLTLTDDRGRILGEVRSDSAPFARLLLDVPLRHDQTIFDETGLWFPYFAGLLLLAVVLRMFVGAGQGFRWKEREMSGAGEAALEG